MRKIPISGGPHTGKTTLLEALRQDFPEAYFVPEPATEVIEHELGLKAADDSHIPNVPWIDYKKFGPLVADKSEELEGQIPEGVEIAFQDRSLIDTIAYARLNDFESFVPAVQRRVAVAKYAFALFCEPVGEYAANHVRRETSEEAFRTHAFLRDAYFESGLHIVELPAVSVETRLGIVRDAVAEII